MRPALPNCLQKGMGLKGLWMERRREEKRPQQEPCRRGGNKANRQRQRKSDSKVIHSASPAEGNAKCLSKNTDGRAQIAWGCRKGLHPPWEEEEGVTPKPTQPQALGSLPWQASSMHHCALQGTGTSCRAPLPPNPSLFFQGRDISPCAALADCCGS